MFLYMLVWLVKCFIYVSVLGGLVVFNFGVYSSERIYRSGVDVLLFAHVLSKTKWKFALDGLIA